MLPGELGPKHRLTTADNERIDVSCPHRPRPQVAPSARSSTRIGLGWRLVEGAAAQIKSISRLPPIAVVGHTLKSLCTLFTTWQWGRNGRKQSNPGGPEPPSTLGKSLADEGFIHCSLASQVGAIADAVYRGRTHGDVADHSSSSLVPVEIRLERHSRVVMTYFLISTAILPLAAVVRAESVTPKDDGTFDLRELL